MELERGTKIMDKEFRIHVEDDALLLLLAKESLLLEKLVPLAQECEVLDAELKAVNARIALEAKKIYPELRNTENGFTKEEDEGNE